MSTFTHSPNHHRRKPLLSWLRSCKCAGGGTPGAHPPADHDLPPAAPSSQPPPTITCVPPPAVRNDHGHGHVSFAESEFWRSSVMMISEGTSEASAEEPEFHDARSWLSRLSVGSSVGSSVFADDPAIDHHELDPSLLPAGAAAAEPSPTETPKSLAGGTPPPTSLLPSPGTSPRERHRKSLMNGISSMLGWRTAAHHGASAHRNDGTLLAASDSTCGTPVHRTASLCHQLQASAPPWVPPRPLRSLGKRGQVLWMGSTDH